MKILHTSDWHLGRSFGTYGLLPDQEAFLEWFISTATNNEVDLVVIAGDIYDRTTPPAEAMRAFDHAVSALTTAGIDVAAIAGNHDSPDRVTMYHSVTERNGLILRGGYPDGADVVVRQYDDGPLAIAAIPFLDPRMIPPTFTLLDPADGPFSHNAVATACAEAARGAIPDGMRSLAIAHGFIAGGQGSDSERTPVAVIGGSDHIGAQVFEGFSYTALGHLHRPQTVRGLDHIRYSGTPLAYSFSETEPKSVVMVSMDSKGSCQTELIPVPVGRPVRTLTDSFENLMASDPDDHSLIRIQLTDTTAVRNAKRRLEDVFGHIVELKLLSLGTPGATPAEPNANLEASLAEQVKDFLETASGLSADLDQFDLVIDALTEAGADVGPVAEVRASIAVDGDSTEGVAA